MLYGHLGKRAETAVLCCTYCTDFVQQPLLKSVPKNRAVAAVLFLDFCAGNDSHPLPWKTCLIFVPWSVCLLLYPLPRFLCLLTWKHCLSFAVHIFCLSMCANKCCCTFAEISSLLFSFFSLLRKISSSPSLLIPICSWKNEWPFPPFPPLT